MNLMVSEMMNEIDLIERVRTQALAKYKDTGTCVGGMHLKYDGRKIADQLWQGNMPNYRYFDDLKFALINELGYDETKFVTEDGWMD